MIDESEALGDRSIEARRRVHENYLSIKALSVAVLGPNLDNIDEIGTQKRYQIRDALSEDGHEPFFPESLIDTSDSTRLWIADEQQLLRDTSVDLIILLYTEGAQGAYTELSNFVTVPEIRSKTALLYPLRFYEPRTALSGNTAQGYYKSKIYTEDEMNECRVIANCKKWADDRRNGDWPGLEAHQF